jgi:amino-acid N-acetyltransferase
VRHGLRVDGEAGRASGVNLEIERATPGDLAHIQRLLTAARLPTDDLATAPIEFWVARRGGAIAGTIALERYGAEGLLRSLAVDASARRGGVGSALVARLEADARFAGIATLVLLTQTAAPFFASRGYEPLDRAAVPGDVGRSAQFSSLCPASARCLAKSLINR